jgi:exosome complex RNA-binding protein Rrp42 (RNase PH superfamily)
VDMESLCVVAGKHVWSVRVDLHILDNGGYGLLGYALSDDIINL